VWKRKKSPTVSSTEEQPQRFINFQEKGLITNIILALFFVGQGGKTSQDTTKQHTHRQGDISPYVNSVSRTFAKGPISSTLLDYFMSKFIWGRCRPQCHCFFVHLCYRCSWHDSTEVLQEVMQAITASPQRWRIWFTPCTYLCTAYYYPHFGVWAAW